MSGICFLLALRTDPALPFFKASQHSSVSVVLDLTTTGVDRSRYHYKVVATANALIISVLHSVYTAFMKSLEKSPINSFNQRNMGERVNHDYVRVGESRNLAPGRERLVRSYHPAHLFINIMIAQEKLCIFKPSVLISIVLSAIYIRLAELWI